MSQIRWKSPPGGATRPACNDNSIARITQRRQRMSEEVITAVLGVKALFIDSVGVRYVGSGKRSLNRCFAPKPERAKVPNVSRARTGAHFLSSFSRRKANMRTPKPRNFQINQLVEVLACRLLICTQADTKPLPGDNYENQIATIEHQ